MMKSRDGVRPTTQQGLVAITSSTPFPTRNVIDQSYVNDHSQQLKRQLTDQIRLAKEECARREQDNEGSKIRLQRYQNLSKEVDFSEQELFLLSMTLDKCLQGVPSELVLQDTREIAQENAQLKNEINQLKQRIANIREQTITTSVKARQSDKRMNENEAQFQIQSEVVLQWMGELLWEQEHLLSFIRCQESKIEMDLSKQETYRKLKKQFEMEAVAFLHSSIPQTEDELTVDRQIHETTKQILKFIAQKALSRRQSSLTENIYKDEEVQEMKEFLSALPRSCNEQKNEIKREETVVISTLDELLGQQTRRELFQRLSNTQDKDQQRITEGLLGELGQKQTELQKVDILEKKIQNELSSLENKIENINRNEIEERDKAERVTTEISQLRTQNQTLKDYQRNLQDEIQMLENDLELRPDYVDVKQSFEEECSLQGKLKELKFEAQRIETNCRLIEDEKQRSLSLLDQLNLKLIEASDKN